MDGKVKWVGGKWLGFCSVWRGVGFFELGCGLWREGSKKAVRIFVKEEREARMSCNRSIDPQAYSPKCIALCVGVVGALCVGVSERRRPTTAF